MGHLSNTKLYKVALLAVAGLTAFVSFAASDACSQALSEGLILCGGPLLLSLFPFLIVSTLMIRCGASETLGIFLNPVARFCGVKAPCAGGILLLGLLGGFAPAAKAVAEAVKTGELSADDAAALLPACICSGPSFVILSVGQGMLGSADLGLRMFIAQVLAGYISAIFLRSLHNVKSDSTYIGMENQTAVLPLRLDEVIGDAAISYIRLCGFILFFRMLSGGLSALLPAKAHVFVAMVLEVCSGCDLASKYGRWAGVLCCCALSVQGLSALLQVRTTCPSEVSFRPLLISRIIHLPLSLILFRLLIPRGVAETFSTLSDRVIIIRRVPLDCALLAFLGCCLLACYISHDMSHH